MRDIEISPGSTICDAAKLAVKKAVEIDQNVSFEFNGVPMAVNPESYYGDIVSIYYLQCYIDRHKMKRKLRGVTNESN